MTGSLTLARYRAPRLRITCDRCNQRRDYSTARLIGRDGPNCRLPDLLSDLTADCPGRDRYSIRRCDAIFPDLGQRT